jgi:hypothetical protein
MDDEEMAALAEAAFEDGLAALIAGLRSHVPEEVHRAVALADRDLKIMVGTHSSVMAPVWQALKGVVDRRETLGDALADRARQVLLSELWSAHYFVKDPSELGELNDWYHQQPDARPFEGHMGVSSS